MKKILLSLMILGSGFGLSTAQAIDLGVNASYWDTSDGDSVWGVGGKVGVPFIINRLLIEGRIYQFKEEDVDFFGDVDITPVDLGLAFHITQDQSVNPFILAGVSYNFVDSSDIGLDSNFGYYLGGGLDVPLGEGFGLVGEALFRSAEFDAKSGLSESFDTTGMTINVGLRFRL